MSEEICRKLVWDHFEGQREEYPKMVIEPEKSENPRIQKLLRGASKTGKGIGRPDLIISGIDSNLLIVVECKASVRKHQSKTGDKYTEYAVDGVINYMTYLTKGFDVIGLAVSGRPEHYKVSTFLGLKSEHKFRDLTQDKLVDIVWYVKKYIENPLVGSRTKKQVKFFIKKLHEDFRDTLSLSQEEKPLLLSAVLIALGHKPFRDGYKAHKKADELAKDLWYSIKCVLDKSKVGGKTLDDSKVALMLNQYGFIKTHPMSLEKSDVQVLRETVEKIEENLFDVYYRDDKTYRENGHDAFGEFYIEFLKYAGTDKGLGIVLTPTHITELFTEIVDVHYDDKVFDSCCGTGGFLISAMKKMIEEVDGNEEEILKIKQDRIYGVELNAKMFTLACSNMFLKGDGKANIYQGDCKLVVKKEIKGNKPNKCLINPPYALKEKGKKVKEYTEFHFIKYALDGLVKNGLCVAIVPMSCAIKPSEMKEVLMKEHTLLGVMSMPNELFHNSDAGTIPCIMVWNAHIPHNSEVETWFGYWKDDGFVKDRVKGRTDEVEYKWQPLDENKKPIKGAGIKWEWINMWRNRWVIPGKSVKQKVTAKDEWCAEAYMETDYSTIGEKDFDIILKDLIAWRIQNG